MTATHGLFSTRIWASVSSDNVDDVLAALNGIERDRLSSADRELLDAATAIAKAVLDEPRHTSAVTPPSEPTPAEAGPPQEAALENNDIVENEQKRHRARTAGHRRPRIPRRSR